MRDFSLHSGERIAAFRLDDIALDHVARYEFAASYLAERAPRFGLDCFCGSGYGTALLGERLGANILGIDGSLEAIQQASRLVGNSNVMFAQKFFPFSLPQKYADFIVSMESLEHVEDDAAFARMLTNTLVPGGTLIVSAPNRARMKLEHNPYHWHYRHYTPDEAISLFKGFGMEFKFLLSADCNVMDGEKCIVGNSFSPKVNPLRRDDRSGDTCTYVFRKAEIVNAPHPIFETKYYAMDWRYGRAISVLLKYLHFSQDIPFKISGIIHDEVRVPEVDGLPLIAANDFVRTRHEGPTSVIAMGPLAQEMWGKMPEPKPPLVTMGELTRNIATVMKQMGMRAVRIGPLSFPDIFEGQQALSVVDTKDFGDELSQKVLTRYLEFLREPQWLGFDDVLSPPCTNCYDPEWFIFNGFMNRQRPNYVVEIADQPTSLPEQFVSFMPPQGKYFLNSSVTSDSARHRALLDDLKPGFLNLLAAPEKIPAPVRQDPTTLILMNTADKNAQIPELPKLRFAARAGDSAANFRALLDLSLAAHPNGRRALRISGRYPNSLFLFSQP